MKTPSHLTALLLGLCLPALALAQTSPAPTATWSFDQVEKNAFAGSGSKPAAARIEGTVSLAPGKQGGCAGFVSEPAGQIVIPLDLVSLAPDRRFTIEFWLRLNGRPSSYGNCLDAGANKGFVIRVNSGGRLSLSGGGTWNALASDTALPEQVWTHVALVHENGALRLYAGGRPLGEIPLADPSAIRPELRLGSINERTKQPDGSITESVVKALTGDIDELKVHARALSSVEIAKAAR